MLVVVTVIAGVVIINIMNIVSVIIVLISELLSLTFCVCLQVSHFLINFSKTLSSYYSRYHILGVSQQVFYRCFLECVNFGVFVTVYFSIYECQRVQYKTVKLEVHIEGSRPEWCISTIYHA